MLRLVVLSFLLFFSQISYSGEIENSLFNFLQKTNVREGTIPVLKSVKLKGLSNIKSWSWPNFSNYPSRISLIATASSGQKYYVPIVISWQARNAVVAMKNIRWGVEILQDDLKEVSNVDISNTGSDWFKTKQEVIDYKAMSPVNKGSVLFYSKVKKLPAVKRGQMVKYVSQLSGIRVERVVKAMNDAFIGDLVRVKVKNSRQLMTGKVLSKGIVLAGATM